MDRSGPRVHLLFGGLSVEAGKPHACLSFLPDRGGRVTALTEGQYDVTCG